jgi:uncharacterized protein (DUF1697 family)
MAAHLALLRGINVSGQKIIKMEDLRKLLEESGFRNVQTYIQSGNIIFDSAEMSKAKLSLQIKDVIRGKYGFDVSMIILNRKDLSVAIKSNPFSVENGDDMKQVYVCFLSENPTDENIAKFKAANIESDRAELFDHVIYLKYHISAAKTKLSNALIENKLKLTATTRNWNTTLKLMELLFQRD